MAYTDQSRAKMFRKHYSQIPAVYFAMKEFLRQNGMYVPLSVSFLNLTASRSYRIYNVLGFEAKERFWDMLHNEYAENLGWQNRETEEFEEKDVCEFVANVILYTHKQYKKRLAKGHRLDLDKLAARFKNAKIKKRLLAFFRALTFRKRKKV